MEGPGKDPKRSFGGRPVGFGKTMGKNATSYASGSFLKLDSSTRISHLVFAKSCILKVSQDFETFL